MRSPATGVVLPHQHCSPACCVSILLRCAGPDVWGVWHLFVYLLVCLFCFEAGSQYVSQASVKHWIHLPQHPKCWYCRKELKICLVHFVFVCVAPRTELRVFLTTARKALHHSATDLYPSPNSCLHS